jgi:phosphatidylglycerol---prolipoprotein diacylglyceryl transferase
MMQALIFPDIDPVAIQIGPFAIKWYALAYIAGIVLGWQLLKRLSRVAPAIMSDQQADDFVVWATLGVVLGGRIGYVLFYRPGHFLFHPLEILQLWQGGMSFHGGLIGVLLAMWLFGRRYSIPFLRLGDGVAAVTPIGLFFGRIANFVNGELWGRASDMPWAMVFPTGGPVPRHPSQLYQAFFEGACLFAATMAVAWRPSLRARPGFIGGVFVFGYGVARIVGELFREPDPQLGYILGFITMGQILSVPMVAAGLWLIRNARALPAATRPPRFQA